MSAGGAGARLTAALEGAGKHPVLLDDRIVILPTGGRVIGLFPDGETNALWCNPALEDASAVKAFFEGDGWLNSGGARGWVSPEGETNVGDLDRFWDSYEVPASMDPASYWVVDRGPSSVVLKTDLPLTFHRHGAVVSLELTRRVSAVRSAEIDRPDGVLAAGFRLESVLSLLGEPPATVRPAIWNLTQVPGGGRMIVPVDGEPEPKAFIGSPSLRQTESGIECEVVTDVSFKFGLKGRWCRGYSWYRLDDSGRSLAVELKHTVLDERFYSDYPADDPDDTGYVEQFYVDDGAMGGFGELEYHSACIEPGERNDVADTCEVTAFVGPEGAVDELLARRAAEAERPPSV